MCICSELFRGGFSLLRAPRAVEESFGADVDYAQLVKIYGAAPESFKGRYSTADCIGAEKHPDRRRA